MNKEFLKKGAGEFVVFVLATLGFSDFVLNTALFKKTGWVKDEILPGTLVCCYLVPGVIIALAYVTGPTAFELKTLLICTAVYISGVFFGSGKMLSLDGEILRKIIGFAMLFSMIALIIRLIISRGTPGTAGGLFGIQFAIALPVIFVLGFTNPFGVPSKPPGMALFMLLGVSPLATLTYLMVMGIAGTATAGIRIIKSGRYEKSMFKAAAIFGTLGAIAGSQFALSINTLALTMIMLFVMAFVAYTMLHKKQ